MHNYSCPSSLSCFRCRKGGDISFGVKKEIKINLQAQEIVEASLYKTSKHYRLRINNRRARTVT